MSYGINPDVKSLNTHRRIGIENPAPVQDMSPLVPGGNGGNSLLQTSTNIFIYSNGAIVGMIQSFTVSENRNINKLQAIGWEGVVQAVPSNTNGGQLSVTRIALYESNLGSAFGITETDTAGDSLGGRYHEGDGFRNVDDIQIKDDNTSNVSSGTVFRTLRDQRVPFEILTKTPMRGTTSNGAMQFYTERYVDCWLSSYSKSYTVQSITVAENATIQYGDVY